MRITPKRASARVYLSLTSVSLFLACFYAPISSVDLPSSLNSSEVQEIQNGRDISSESYERINELLDDTNPKEYIRSISRSTHDNHDAEGNDAVSVGNCTLDAESIQQMKSVGESVWIINETTLDLLDNDPQKLIQCTQPGDRVTFSLTRVQKFEQTLLVVHDLELVSDSRKPSDKRSFATFTCPDDGPFLRIKHTKIKSVLFSLRHEYLFRSRGFSASGFNIQNCTSSIGNSAVVIESDSEVVLEDSKFIANRNRALFAAWNSKLALNGCSFDDNHAQFAAGGAVFVESWVSLLINGCFFRGNLPTVIAWTMIRHYFVDLSCPTDCVGNNGGYRGGAISGYDRVILTIFSSNFYGNSADMFGGAIHLRDYNHVFIMNSTFSRNNTSVNGGAIFLFKYNVLTIMHTTLLGNNALRGGAINVCNNSTVTIRNTKLLRNVGIEDGGAIMVYYGNTLTIADTTLSMNNAKFGGALHFGVSNVLKTTNTTWLGNNARSGGAIMANDDNKITFIDTKLLRNKASEYGGVILFSDGNSLDIYNSELLGNTAKWDGGALKFGIRSSCSISYSSLSGNIANQGGAMYLAQRNYVYISQSLLLDNNSSRGGAIFAELDCQISIDRSTSRRNRAEFGGCVYGVASSIYVSDSTFGENSSSKSGGCFNIDSASAYFTRSELSLNKAMVKGGAIHASSGMLLSMDGCTIDSNSAAHGGGIALVSDSRILCTGCTIKDNSADIGGGFYIESHMKHIVIAQFFKPTFQRNRALCHGGGIAIKTFGIKSSDCANAAEPCDRVLLLLPSFVGNRANLSSSAILATKTNNLLVACEAVAFKYATSGFFEAEDIRLNHRHKTFKMKIDSEAPCAAWKDNWAHGRTNGGVIGTFGQKLNLTIDSINGSQISGDNRSGFVLRNIRSGEKLPKIIATAISDFGYAPAPTLYLDARLTSKNNTFLTQSIGLSFENGTCVINNIVRFVVPGEYSLQFSPKPNDILEALDLTIVVRACVVNEVSIKQGMFCQKCSEASYNFDASVEERCTPCPENAKCEGKYIVPEEGYWHKSPCHAIVKKCVSEEACKFQGRSERISNFTRDFIHCNMTNATLDTYSSDQCHEGYKGPLCGSCNESYGISSSLECVKCGHVVKSVLALLAIACYLLFGVVITIKSVLALTSKKPTSEDVETPLIEANTSTIEATSSSQPIGVIGENNNNTSRIETFQEEVNSSNALQQQTHEIETAKQKAIEAWKILLNFIQVTSTAATMDVKWTDEALGTLEKLQVMGVATINYVAGPLDCLLSSASRSIRVVWRTLFSIFIPTIVIAVLSMYWGYRCIMVHEGDSSYFLKRFLLTLITTTYITYFDLTKVAVRVFNCVVVHDNINPLSNSFTRYWIADTSTECYKGTHVSLIGIALIILVLISLGFPLLCSLSLYAKKDEVNTANSWAHDTLSFLCGPYKERFVYWECVTMIKKALLSIIIVFSYSLGNQAQGLLLLTVLGSFLYLHLTCNPYEDRFNILNYYEGGSLLVSCTTYTLVQFLNVDTLSKFARGLVSFSIILIDGVFVCIMVYRILSNIIRVIKAILESKNFHVSDTMNWFSIMKLYYKNRKKPHLPTNLE